MQMRMLGVYFSMRYEAFSQTCRQNESGEIGVPVTQQRQEVVSWQEVMSEAVKPAADEKRERAREREERVQDGSKEAAARCADG